VNARRWNRWWASERQTPAGPVPRQPKPDPVPPCYRTRLGFIVHEPGCACPEQR